MTLHYSDGTTEVIEIPPHPNLHLLDDDNLEAYLDLQFEADTTYERFPDVILPEQRLDNGIIIPEETKQGLLKTNPYRRIVIGEDGEKRSERVKPAWEIQVVEAVLGKETFDKIKAAEKTSWATGEGNGNAKDVQRIWNEQGLEQAERAAGDPKSV
jgi:hypothetical protein